jgi:uncharacterized membrane protein YfcA
MSSARDRAQALLGLAIGAWSRCAGFGGGVFAVPLLHYAYGYELRAAVANSLLARRGLDDGGDRGRGRE